LSFVQRHGLWSDEQREAATRLRRTVEDERLEVIRLSFPDQHGILRGKTLVAGEALASLESGCTITTTMLAKDTSHRTVFPVFTAGGGFGMREMEGAADVLPATRLENRIGEPAANPYLYMASQILAGLDGVDRSLDPGPSADTPYETKATLLPKTLHEAVSALKEDPFLREALGAEFVDYYVHIKNAEIERFQAEVSEWEQREYFEMF